MGRGEPPPSSTGRQLRPRLGDARHRRVAGHPITSGRCTVRTASRPSNQRRCRLLLLDVVVGDPDEPTALWRLAALCWQCRRRRRIRCHWPFPRHSPRWSGRGWPGPPHCWCNEYTEQRLPPADLPPQDSPFQVPVTHIPCNGQHLRSTKVTKISQQQTITNAKAK